MRFSQPLRHKLIGSSLAGVAAGTIAYALQHSIDAPSNVTLGVSLAVYGVVEAIVLEGRRGRHLETTLREMLRSFIESCSQRRDANPLWHELNRQMMALLDAQPDPKLRQALREGLAEVAQLADHVSFVALQEQDIKAIRRLRDLMEEA